jgi:hypothetical protein
MANNLPIAKGFDVTLQAGAFVPISSLFSWSDVDGDDAVTAFAVRESVGGGRLFFSESVLTPQPEGVLFDQLPIAQISSVAQSWFYRVGSVGTVEQIEFYAIDSHGAYSTAGVATVTSAASAPGDLSVDSINLGSTTLSPGSTVPFGFNWTFSEGSGGTANWTVGQFLSVDPTITAGDIPLGNFGLPFSAPPNAGGGAGGSVTLPFDLPFGRYYIGVLLDNGGQVAESNEENNARSIPITIAPTGYVITPGLTVVDENAGSITFTVKRTGVLEEETLYVSTVSAEGFSNEDDYAGLVNQPLAFAAGEASKTVTVALTDDAFQDPGETFGVIVQRYPDDPISTYLMKSRFIVQDNDLVPTSYSIAPGSVAVNEGAGTVAFTISRSGNLPAETVYASTAQTEGFANSGDYSGLLNQAVSFAANEPSKTVTIALTNDTVAEIDETFSLIVQRNAADPVSTYLAKSTFTVRDDDAYTISPASGSFGESAGFATFTIGRPARMPRPSM